MSLFSVLKTNSKLALRGNWGRAICALLIPGGVALVLYLMQGAVINLFVEPFDFDPAFAVRHGFNSYFFHQFAKASLLEVGITTGFTLLGILLLSPLSLGITWWYYELVQGRNRPLSEMFRYFESGRGYRRSLWLEINLRVRSFLWGLAFFAVPAVLFGGCLYVVTLGEAAGRAMLSMASAGLVLSAALFLLAILFYGALLNKYLLAAYLLCEDDGLGVWDAIRRSAAYTRGYRFSLLWYQFSFLGWLLLCVLVFPLLYVAPYLNTALAMYGRYIIEKREFQPPDPTREFRPQQGHTGEREAVGIEPPPAEAAEPAESHRPEPPVWPRFDDPAPEGEDLSEAGEEFRFPQSRHPPAPEEEPPSTPPGE